MFFSKIRSYSFFLLLLQFVSLASSPAVLAGGSAPYGRKMPIEGNTAQLKSFFDALKNSRNTKVRIAHYGDSIIMGDIISEDLRINMQKKFGGNGAGFISVYSDDNRMRATTFHNFSDNWNSATLYKRNPQKLSLGISGSVAIPQGDSWVKYEINRNARWLKSFKTARVFYSDAQPSSSLYYSFNNQTPKPVKLKGGDGILETELTATDAQSFLLNGSAAQGVHFYGVSLENGNGVYVDNFPVKGNSGVSLADISAETYRDFNKLLNYRLIILNFGVNVVSVEHANYNWYENKMIKVIEQMKEAFPAASILIVSIGDKSIKRGPKFVSDPAIQQVIKAQKSVAEKTGVAFWNLFEAMGGSNTMAEWVSAAPPLALRDYTHLTADGGKIVGDLLMQALMDEYSKY